MILYIFAYSSHFFVNSTEQIKYKELRGSSFSPGLDANVT